MTTVGSASSSPATSSTANGSGVTTDDETDTVVSEAGQCGDSQRCIPPPPPGWDGPVAAGVGADFRACPPTFDRTELQTFSPPGAAVCDCTCGGYSGECTTTLEIFPQGDLGCSAAQAAIPVGDSCGNISTDTTVHVSASPAEFANGECGTANQTSFDALEIMPVTICTPSSASDACDGGNCVPQQIETLEKICAVREGDHPCPPAGPYTDRFLAAEAISDDRMCPECECNLPQGNCIGTLEVDDTNGCGAGSVSVRPGACEEILSAGQISARLTDIQFLGACEPTLPEVPAIGEITSTGGVTLCCIR